jgi:isopenicillin N synthase-like dioxygenase
MFLKTSRYFLNRYQLRHFSQKVVKINYTDLLDTSKSKQLYSNIEEAYGKDGLGILIIEKVPEYLEARENLFKLTHQIVNLPESSLRKVETPPNYEFGWSHGKEYLSDKPDYLKASYYANLRPVTDPNSKDRNIWPEEIPEAEKIFHRLGNIIRGVGVNLLDVIDSYIKNTYQLYNLNYRKLVESSKENKGRMLYYYPRKAAKNSSNVDQENWCEWHNDHGSLTGLTSAMYVDENGKESTVNLSNTGLYIQNRKGENVRVTFGKQDIAYQLGECLQVHSGGILHATPHAVKVFNDIPENIARITFALFMEPNHEVIMNPPEGSKIENIKTSDIYHVPKIQDRFKEGMTFGEFNQVTINTYYKK